eukprot:6207688-Pleurochrysis_carterae.AAC.1
MARACILSGRALRARLWQLIRVDVGLDESILRRPSRRRLPRRLPRLAQGVCTQDVRCAESNLCMRDSRSLKLVATLHMPRTANDVMKDMRGGCAALTGEQYLGIMYSSSPATQSPRTPPAFQSIAGCVAAAQAAHGGKANDSSPL